MIVFQSFVPSKEIPKMFPTQNPVEGYQVKDFIRGGEMFNQKRSLFCY